MSAEVGQRELLGDQHAVALERALGLLDAEQVAQQAQADVLHVGRALAQVVVAHRGERARGTRRPRASAPLSADAARLDVRLDLAEEAAVLEHHAVRVDDRAVELRQPRG